MLIGERIKKKRIELGISQQELGDLVGVSKVSICGYEKGNRTPTVDTFILLTEVLKTTPEYLLGHDVNVVEEFTGYSMKMSREDIQIIREIKSRTELYNKILENPKRMIEYISRRVK